MCIDFRRPTLNTLLLFTFIFKNSCSLSFTQDTLQDGDDLTLPKWHRKKCELLAEKNKEPDAAIREIKGRGSIGGVPSVRDSGYDTPFLRSSSLPCTSSSVKTVKSFKLIRQS